MRSPEGDNIYAIGEHTEVLLWVGTLSCPATEPAEATHVRRLLPGTELGIVLLLLGSELIGARHLDHGDSTLEPLLVVEGELLLVRPLATSDSRESR